MTDRLSAFLIGVAKSEKKLASYLKDPERAVVKAGLSRQEIAALMTRDAQKIFKQLKGIHAEEPFPEPFIWICVSSVTPKRPGRRSQTTGRAPARHRR